MNYNRLLDFFFAPLLTPIIWINKFIMKTFPNFMMAMPVLNKPVVQFILLILFILYFLTSYQGFTQEVINKCVFYDITATYGPEYKIFFTLLYLTAFYSFVKSMFDLTPSMLHSVIVLIIVLLIKFIVVMSFTPLSGLIIVFYFLIYSLFSFVMFNNYDVSNGMKMVRDYIFNIEYAEEIAEKSSACKNNLDKCKSMSFYDTVITMCKHLFLLKYVYIIEVLLVMTILTSMTDYVFNINSPDLKAGMTVLSVLMIGIIIAMAIFRNSLTIGSTVLSKNSNQYMQKFYKRVGETNGQACAPTKPND